MRQHSLTFDGFEIERVISFVLFAKRPDSQFNILNSTVKGYASLLTDETSPGPTTFSFNGSPTLDATIGFKRSIIFPDSVSPNRRYDYGGRNAIREEWRLDEITFELACSAEAVSTDVLLASLEELFPPGNRTPDPSAEREILFHTCRRALLGISPIEEAAIPRARALLLEAWLNRPIATLDGPSQLLELVCDVQDPTLLREICLHPDPSAKKLSGLAHPLMRRLFARGEFGASAGVIAGDLIRQSEEDVIAATTSYGGRDERLLHAANAIEALSFWRTPTAALVDRLGQLVTSTSERWRGNSGDKQLESVLTSALLSYAELHTRVQEATPRLNHGAIRREIQELATGSGDHATLRIAAVAATALLAPRQGPDFEQSFKTIQKLLVQSLDGAKRRAKAPARTETAQQRIDHDAEICACADAFSRLYRYSIGPSPKLLTDQFSNLAALWARTELPAPRRSLARTLIEHGLRGGNLGTIAQCVTKAPRTVENSIRGLVAGKGANGPFDLPSTIVLLAVERYRESRQLASNVEARYSSHPESSALLELMQLMFACADAADLSDYPGARVKLEDAILLLNSQRFAFISGHMKDALGAWLSARASSFVIAESATRPDVSHIESAIEAFEKSVKALGELDRVGADMQLSESVSYFMQGIRKSEYWQNQGVWSDKISEEFRKAVKRAEHCKSVNWIDFCAVHLDKVADLEKAQAESASSTAPAGQVEEWVSAAVAVVWRIGGIFGSRIQGKFMGDRYDLLPTAMETFAKRELRPVALLHIGRVMQW